jgi:hypothetical protein
MENSVEDPQKIKTTTTNNPSVEHTHKRNKITFKDGG